MPDSGASEAGRRSEATGWLTVAGDRGRHQARKRAVDLLFEAEARGTDPRRGRRRRETALAEGDADISPLNPYTVTVARGVTEHAAHIDDLISAHLQGWTLDRLPAVDRAMLRVAVWELLHADDVPEPVAVDEAVELAKQLSTDDSPGFVNGVLGQVMLVTPQIRAASAAMRGARGRQRRNVMGVPQDWAPYSSVEEAARVYLRDPELALDQLRSVINLPAIKSFIMSRGSTEESWGEAMWQEVVLTDGQRLDHVARRRRALDRRRPQEACTECVCPNHPVVDDH